MAMYYRSTSLKQGSQLSDVSPPISSPRFTVSDLSWLPQDGIPEPLTFPQVTPSLLMRETAFSLDSKVPMVPGLDDVVRLRRTKLGVKLYETPNDAEFDLRSPNFPGMEYNYLHDPHLKRYLQRPDVRRSLEKQGLLAKDGSVICSAREFNQFRQMIRRIKLNRMEGILKEMYENEGSTKVYGRRLSERAIEWYDVNRQKQQKAKMTHKEKNRRQRQEQKRLMKRLEQGFRDTELSREEQQLSRVLVCKVRHQEIDDQNDAQRIREIKKRINKIETIAEKDEQYADTCRRYEQMREYERRDKEWKAIEKWKRRQWFYLQMMDAKEQQMEREMEERREWMERRNKIYGRERRKREQSLEHSMQLSKQLANEHLQKANQFLEKAEMRKAAAIKLWRDKNLKKKPFRPVLRETTLKTPKQKWTAAKRSPEANEKKQIPKKSLWTIEQCLNDSSLTNASKLAKGKRLLGRSLQPRSCESAEALRVSESGVRRALGSLGCSKSDVDCMIKDSFGMNGDYATGLPNGSVPTSGDACQKKRHSILLNREMSNPERFKDLLVRFDEKGVPHDREASLRRTSAISERLPTPHPSHSDLEENGSCDTVGSFKNIGKGSGKATEDMSEEGTSEGKLEEIASGNSKTSLMSEVLRGKAGQVGRRATPAFGKAEKKRLFGEFGEKNKPTMTSFGEGEEDEEGEDADDEEAAMMEGASEECVRSEITDDLASSEAERASMAHRLSGCSDIEGSMSEYGRSQRRSSIEARLACSSLTINNNPPKKPAPPEPRRESAASSRFESRESSQNRFKSAFSNISINNSPSLPVSEPRKESIVESQCVEKRELKLMSDKLRQASLDNCESGTNLESDSSEQQLPGMRPSRSRMSCNIDPAIYYAACEGGNGSPSLNSQELIGTVADNEKEKIVSIDVRDELEKDQKSERGLNVKEEAGKVGMSGESDEFARRLTESLSRFTDDKGQGGNDEIKEGTRENKSEANDPGNSAKDSSLEDFVAVHENELANIEDANAGAIAGADSDSSRRGSRCDLTRGKSKISGINIAAGRKNRRRVSIDRPNFDSPKEAGERQIRRTSRSGLIVSSEPNSGDAAVSSMSRRFSVEEDDDSQKGSSLKGALSMVEGSVAGSEDGIGTRCNTFNSTTAPNDSFSGSKIYVTPMSPSMDFTTSVRNKPSGTEQ